VAKITRKTDTRHTIISHTFNFETVTNTHQFVVSYKPGMVAFSNEVLSLPVDMLDQLIENLQALQKELKGDC
jgi:hypothetical protein